VSKAKFSSQLSDPAVISEIVEMALSDHVSFDAIRALYGLSPDDVQALMRQELKPGSYRAWRRRVQKFGSRREHYK
jgi:uncharacterized protein (TIGR03643 family)